ncbi:MAG: pentapeptide repeat-containing protein [Bacteroidaceae bacterium]|nr:pentapeptide repeat-containing protein [Bacteroidaceae bacterium]
MENLELNKLIEKKEIIGVDFSGQRLEGVDFSGCRLERVSFKQCELVHCRFRKSTIVWSDFRYAKIENGTFEDATIDFCDFYRAFIDGVVIFNNSQISNCSFNKTYFGDSAVIRRRQLVDGRILQQDVDAYRKFLTEWHMYGTGERKNDVGAVSDWSADEALKTRWDEAEEIFKNFNALWTSKGFVADGNWAYVKGRRMERHRMIAELLRSNVGFKRKVVNLFHITTNIISDILFGFGESMTRMILTYIVTVFLFAWVFTSNISLLEYGEALAISLKNMAGMDSDALHNVSPLVDMLNIVQTTLGIVMTGIFGFILGNKIRNQ